MKTYQITEAQIKKIHASTSAENQEEIQGWFPEAFEKKLEVGKWYKVIAEGKTYLFVYHDLKRERVYGFLDNEWKGKEYIWFWPVADNRIIEANPSEVEAALVKEAEKRGLKKGVVFDSPDNHSRAKGCEMRNEFIEFNEILNTLHVETPEHTWNEKQSNPAIFDNGQWAEIIPEPARELTKEQIEKELGYKIKIV